MFTKYEVNTSGAAVRMIRQDVGTSTLQCFYTAVHLDVSVACTVQITALLNSSVPAGESIQIEQAGRHQGTPASGLKIM